MQKKLHPFTSQIHKSGIIERFEKKKMWKTVVLLHILWKLNLFKRTEFVVYIFFYFYYFYFFVTINKSLLSIVLL